MQHPDKLMFDHLQSDNYEPESYPGAGDGKGWRLSKNGDFQIGTSSCVGGEIFSPHGNVRVDSPQLDLVYLTQEQIDAAKCDLPPYIVHKPGAASRLDLKVAGRNMHQQGEVTDLEFVVTVSGPGPTDPETQQRLSMAIRQIVVDTLKVECASGGLISQVSTVGHIREEQTARAETDSALASRISGMQVLDEWTHPVDGVGLQLGKEYLAVSQPGGDVKLGRLGGKALGVSDFAVKHLAMSPGNSPHEFAGGLSRMSPMTANGKVPINNLPRPVDDDK